MIENVELYGSEFSILFVHPCPPAPYPSRRSPSDWTSPGEADSGFAGSELPQRKPDSICPPMVASSYQSMGESGEEDEQNGLPSLAR